MVLGLLLNNNSYADSKIVDFKCVVVESKFSDGGECSNCGTDDGFSVDLDKEKILAAPTYKDISKLHKHETFRVKFSNKFIEGEDRINSSKFNFNRFTFDIEHKAFHNNEQLEKDPMGGYIYKVIYKCEKTNKI